MTSFSPVAYVYREMIAETIAGGKSGKIFFFNAEDKVDAVEGQIQDVIENPQGMFVRVKPDFTLRIDRIITVFGKPGPAFDEYDSFANQCLSCTGGYDL
jgi:hypothetical protein